MPPLASTPTLGNRAFSAAAEVCSSCETQAGRGEVRARLAAPSREADPASHLRPEVVQQDEIGSCLGGLHGLLQIADLHLHLQGEVCHLPGASNRLASGRTGG